VIERAVKSVKDCLIKVIGKKRLTTDQLLTLLKEVRQIINSRPLVQVPHGSIEDGLAITPNHLVYGHDLTQLPIGELVITDKRHKPALDYWKSKQTCLKKFKEAFMNQYIDSLMRLKQHVGLEKEPEVGDLVLVSTPVHKRTEWPVGVITAIRPGLDGLSRMVDLRTMDGPARRSIRSLIILRHLDELQDDKQESGEENPSEPADDDLEQQLELVEDPAEVQDEFCQD
jgi:hypothetical protein